MRTYRASSLGYSLEALVAPHLGFEPVDPPEFMQKAFDEGNRIEPLAIQKLYNMGWDVVTGQKEINSVGDQQIEVRLEVIPGVAVVIGHIDARTGGDVIEIKSMAHASWLQFHKRGWDAPGLVQKYKWQASAYMLATGLSHVMVAWDKDTEELCIVPTTEPFYTISDIAKKLQLAEDAIAAGVVPDGCEDFPCPFYFLHPPKDEVAKVEDGELEGLLQSWLTWDRAEKQAKRAKDEHRERILKLAGDQVAAKVKGECGVTVETYWQDENTYTTTRKAGWVSRISGPRAKKGSNVAE